MIFVMDNKEKMVGVLNNSTPSSCPYYEDVHTENLETGVNTYEFSIPGNHETAEVLEAEGYIILTDLDGKQQMFQIKEIEEVAGEVYEKRIYTEHVAIPELLASPFRPYVFKSVSLANAVQIALQGTGWELGDYDWSGVIDLDVNEYTNVLEVIYSIAEAFDAELQFEVIMKNGEIAKRLIHMRERVGTDTKKLFKYGKDLVEVTRTYNTEGIVTALIGVGKGDTEGARLTLAGYNPKDDTQFGAGGSLPTGFEKALSADWIGNTAALQEYGKNGRHKFGIFIDDKAINQSSLFQNTLKELKERMKPKVAYQMKLSTLERVITSDDDEDVFTGEQIRLGDTIIADDDTVRPRYLIEARIIELKRSYTEPEKDECTLGDYRPIKITTFSSLSKIQNMISANEEKWNKLPYELRVASTTGNLFRNGKGSTRLTAQVFHDNKEVDVDGTAYTYHWYKHDKDGNLVIGWGGNVDYKIGKVLTVSASDITEKSIFKPMVYIV